MQGPDPIDPIDPLDPGLLTQAAFAALDPDLPFVLLPVRIETHYVGRPPTELLVRVFPDLLHADAHDPDLTATELDLAAAFWDRTWRAGGDVAGEDAAFAWLAGQIGAWRAAWVADRTVPRNPDDAPTSAVPDDAELLPPPRLPARTPGEGGQPTYARLLPDRWVVVGRVAEDADVGPWYGEAIPDDLVLAPGLAAGNPDVDGPGLLDSQGLAWTRDVDEAEAVGMLVRIDLTALPDDRFAHLFVFGLRGDATREDLAALLTAHRFAHGLDLVPQGTATNATETVTTPWHPDRPDLGAVRASQLGEPPTGPRPDVEVDGDLYAMAAADAASVALGLGGLNALDRALHAGTRDLEWSLAMNRSLWSATLGHYFRFVLAHVVEDGDRDWLRDWATTFVRGGAVLPTLLVGPQPYGLLPVSLVDIDDVEANKVGAVESTAWFLRRDHWLEAVAAIPHLDHNLTDRDPTEDTAGTIAATVSRVMGSVPHPTGFHLRGVEKMREEYEEQYGGNLIALGLEALAFPDEDGDGQGADPDNVAWTVYERLLEDLDLDTTPEGQLHSWERAQESYDLITGTNGDDFDPVVQIPHLRAMGDRIAENVVPLLEAHIERVRPVRSAIGARITTATGMIGEPNEPHVYFTMHGEEGSEVEWSSPLVAAGTTASDVDDLAAVLADLRARVAAGDDSGGGYDEDRPLLVHLLHRSVDLADTDEQRELLGAGLDALIELVGVEPDPIPMLERLLRETLGTVGNRIDAWFTAAASWRLENKRTSRARGLHVGAYGMVVDLRPRRGAASEGFVLAPSLAHATTAAVLRSGWAAFGSAAQSSGLATDLSSDRVRRGRWLVDGVRGGQPLDELLGNRFERRLHDERLDQWVRPVREVVLTATGSDAGPIAVVDGLLLARARGGTEQPTATEQEVARLLDELLSADPSERPPGDPTDVLDSLVDDLDAVADLSVAQGVFSLVEGNVPEAHAALTAGATGEIEFPSLRVTDSPATATTIAHRLVVTVEPDATDGWATDPRGRALAAPALEAWVAGLLGPSSAIGFDLRFPAEDGGSAEVVSATLADVGLGALDLLALVPRGQDPGLGALGRVLAAWGELVRPPGHEGPPPRVAADGGDPSLAEVVVAARELAGLVAAATSLDATDFAPTGAVGVAHGVDLATLAARVDDVAAWLRDRRDALAHAVGDDRVAYATMLELVGLDLPAAVPTTTTGDDLDRQTNRLVAAVTRRLEALDERVTTTGDWRALDEGAAIEELEERLALLVGAGLPPAAPFVVADGAAVAASLDRDRLGRAAAGSGWLAAVGRVRPAAGRLRVAVDLVEALGDDRRVGMHLVQLPDHDDEGWVAEERPTVDDRGRVCVFAAGDRPDPATRVAGLAVASWTEAVPVSRQTPSLAVHFDGPSARAPNTLLLAVTRPAVGFSVDWVRRALIQTLELCQARMVGPESMLDLGQFAPATYLPGDLHAGAPS